LSDKENLLDWFGKRRESVVTSLLREHTQKVADTITELNRSVLALCKEDRITALDALRRSALSEKEADSLEDRITEELSKGDLASKEREDMMHLVRRLDFASDWAKEAGMNIQLVIEADVHIPLTLWNKYCAMTQQLEKAAKLLKTCIDSLGVDEEAVNKYVRGIKVQEHILDDLYFSTKKEIFFSDIDPKAIYLMRDILHCLENSSDKCNEAGEVIRLLMVSQRHKAR
jgi:hypothetical protein